MRRFFASIALTAAVLVPAAASAQQVATRTPLASPSASPLAPPIALRQTAAFAPAAPDAMIRADVAGINTTKKADVPFEVSAPPSNGLHQGQGIALMAVGGAGLVAGLLIG
ncbi:MAG: hypothetical protein ACR2GG_01600, partial [Gemmatimonadaceae bacterium]